VSNIIDFLQRFGRDAGLRRATSEQVQEALREAGIEPVGCAAILGNDRRALEALLRVDGNVCCMVFKEEEEGEETEDEETEEGEDGKEGGASAQKAMFEAHEPMARLA
jgi:hypothetical protein